MEWSFTRFQILQLLHKSVYLICYLWVLNLNKTENKNIKKNTLPHLLYIDHEIIFVSPAGSRGDT